MPPRALTETELVELAEELGLALTAEERRSFPALLAGFLAAYDVVEAAQGELPPAPGERRWWRPPPEENPHNAWYVRTSIRNENGDTGPLAGRSVALKDNVLLAGVPMLNGSALFEGYVPEVDATVVTRLLEAGAEIRGKAHCESFCLSAGSHTNATGPVHNPHRHGYTSGGSSSGSAALVACGDVDLAVGGDQGGSIRVPSAFCGTYGMKPTWGLVPYTGAAPLEPSIDHLGPITGCVRDNALMLEVMAGPDGIDGRQTGAAAQPYVDRLGDGIAGIRVGLVAEGFAHPGGDPAVDATVHNAARLLEKLGASAEEVSIPLHPEAATLGLPILIEGMYQTVLRGDGWGGGRTDLYAPGFAERARSWPARPETLPVLVKLMGLAGCYVEREHGRRFYAKAMNLRRRVRAAYDEALRDLDLLLMPTTRVTAPPLPAPDCSIEESVAAASGVIANTVQFDVSQHPAMSVPCGRVDGMPVGMMLVARHHEEATIYRAAYAFEQAADWRGLGP